MNRENCSGFPEQFRLRSAAAAVVVAKNTQQDEPDQNIAAVVIITAAEAVSSEHIAESTESVISSAEG